MTDWRSIIQRAAYTRFCRTGSLEPFQLARKDLYALATQIAAGPIAWDALQGMPLARVQVRVPVPAVHSGAWVAVDEWAAERAAERADKA